VGQQQALRRLEAERMHIGDEDEQPGHLLPALEQPELAAELDGVDVVGRAAGEADDLRLGSLRLQHERGEVGRVVGVAHGADDLAAHLHDHLGGVALERVAEGVIGSQEEPANTAALDHGARRAGREGIGVEHPLDAIGRAELAGEVGRAGRMGDEQLLLLTGDLLHGEADGRERHVDDQVDVAVIPFPCELRADVGLHLMIGGHDLDRLARHRGAEILGRHLRRDHRTFAGRIRGGPGQVGQHADLHHVVGDLRRRRRGGEEHDDERRQPGGAAMTDHVCRPPLTARRAGRALFAPQPKRAAAARQLDRSGALRPQPCGRQALRPKSRVSRRHIGIFDERKKPRP